MKTKMAFLTGCFAVLFALQAVAANSQSEFDAANKLYAQGNFSEAARAYEKLIQAGETSPAVYFNLGDACFKSGQIGRAIVAYRHATHRTPRDADVRANLQFARNQVSGPTLLTSRWQKWFGHLSLNEWTWLTTAAFWMLFLLLAARQLRPQWRNTGLIFTATALLVIFGAGFGVSLTQHHEKLAVVITSDATAHNGPFEESPNAFTVNDGAEFQILDQKDDWFQVGDGRGRIGWLKNDSVAVVPAA